MPNISGATRQLPIIGRPIGQVKAPLVFNRYFQESGIDAVTVPLELEDGAADAFIQAMRGMTNAIGFIATIPHKQRSAAAADRLSDRAAFLGAANIVRRDADGSLAADMTDGLGCVAAMRTHGMEPRGKSALVIGSGGAGSAIAHALCEAGVAQLALSDLDPSRAAALVARLAETFSGVELSTNLPQMETVDIAVNASPVGMHDDARLPMPLDGVRPGVLVADVVTMPAETSWLAEAKRRGCVAQTGLEMVEGQFKLMASHFGLA